MEEVEPIPIFKPPKAAASALESRLNTGGASSASGAKGVPDPCGRCLCKGDLCQKKLSPRTDEFSVASHVYIYIYIGNFCTSLVGTVILV